MPSVFAWRVPIVLMDPVWQPTIVYPARGVGMLWKPATSQVPTALAALFGRRRGDIFIALDQPRTTLELARRFGIPASSVSQHLGVLRQAGLVSGHRVGRQVLYVRTPRGDALAGTPQ
jgi:DNA-binding transcriptional ArsR family regulator